jgi:hypothetical protein
MCVALNIIDVNDDFTKNVSPLLESTISAIFCYQVPSK